MHEKDKARRRHKARRRRRFLKIIILIGGGLGLVVIVTLIHESVARAFALAGGVFALVWFVGREFPDSDD